MPFRLNIFRHRLAIEVEDISRCAEDEVYDQAAGRSNEDGNTQKVPQSLCTQVSLETYEVKEVVLQSAQLCATVSSAVVRLDSYYI